MHAHDDLGLATATSLAAVRGGATHVSTTVNGLGERAGNAPLEEIVVALHQLYRRPTGIDARQLPRISALVAGASGRPVPAGKSIVGDAVFTHEAGIHVHGLIRDRAHLPGDRSVRGRPRAPRGAGQALRSRRRPPRLRRDEAGPRSAAGAKPSWRCVRRWAEMRKAAPSEDVLRQFCERTRVLREEAA